MNAESEGRVLAAVDLGSNSFHMIVARVESGSLVVLDRIKEMVRLASGLDNKDRLKPSKWETAIDCLARFGERLSDFHPDNVAAVGTNTLRKAKNSDDFLAEAEKALGMSIDIISGREEARLVFLGAVHGAPPTDGRRLVIDIGGGSTELISGEGDEPLSLYSLFMGCVGVSRRFFPNGEISAERIAEARVAIDLELKPVVGPLKAHGWQQVLGCSGTLRTVAKMIRELDPTVDEVAPADVRRLVSRFASVTHVDQLPFETLDERRRPVMMGGLMIVDRLFNALDIKSMGIADGALREGLLHDMLGSSLGDDVRDRTVRALQARYQVDTDQADRVEQIVVQLLDCVAEDWSLAKPKWRQPLIFAARLHEIGLSIAHSHYHRHGAYIVGNADLPGFGRLEQIKVAWLIEGHRRRVPDALPLHMRLPAQRRLPRMLALLRVAVALTRGRQETELPRLKAKVSGDKLALKFPKGWLADHPLTAAGLQSETGYLDELGVTLKFS